MPAPTTTPPPTAPAADAGPAALLAVVDATLRDLHPGAPGLPPVGPDSVLDQDLGFDSLARMELLLRIERAFGVDLPADTLQRAETVADVCGRAAGGAAAAPAVPHGAGGAAAAAERAARRVGRAGDAAGRRAGRGDDAARGAGLACAGAPGPHAADPAWPTTARRRSATASSPTARRVAAGLQRAGVVPRQSVAIMLPTCPSISAPTSASCAPARYRCRSTRRRAPRSSRTMCCATPASSTTRRPC